MTPDEYCAERVGRDTDAHYSLLFVAPEARRGARAVYAFVREAREIADDVHDAGVAQTKLDWWCEEIERLYRGEPRHPVAQALAPNVATRHLEREHFFTLLGETARSVGGVRYPNFDMLHDHCRCAGAPAMRLIAGALGIDNPSTRTDIEALGAALRLADILSSLGQDVRHDRLFLPVEDLRRFGVDQADVLACRHTPAFETLMAFEIERARQQLDDVLARLPSTDSPAAILARLARARLDEVRHDGYRVLERRVALTPLRKLWIAWRTRLT